jgi:hypothetical protein
MPYVLQDVQYGTHKGLRIAIDEVARPAPHGVPVDEVRESWLARRNYVRVPQYSLGRVDEPALHEARVAIYGAQVLIEVARGYRSSLRVVYQREHFRAIPQHGPNEHFPICRGACQRKEAAVATVHAPRLRLIAPRQYAEPSKNALLSVVPLEVRCFPALEA